MPKCRDTGTVIKTDSEAVKVEALVKKLFYGFFFSNYYLKAKSNL